jgi:lipid-A-disaccharide synthase
MRIFISAGEPSGDLHGANLIHHLKHQNPGVETIGFGGERMAKAGAKILYPLAATAITGFSMVLASIPKMIRILGMAREQFRTQRPDAVVLIDYPDFHWWIAGCAKKFGIPVVYFVPPQLWAWRTGRVKKMRRLVDRVLCNLPFEKTWYAEHGVDAQCIGHPYFDELREQELDKSFMNRQRTRRHPIIALLPGSRDQELRRNFPSLLRAAASVHSGRPDVRFLVACLRPDQAALLAGQASPTGLPIEVHARRTPEIIELAHSCISVSGSVSLELLYRTKPSVMIYRENPFMVRIAHLIMRCKYITLVNLLADRRLFPEYLTGSCPGDKAARHILEWLNDPPAHDDLRRKLAALRDRVVEPGACQRAAAAVLELARGQQRQAA